MTQTGFLFILPFVWPCSEIVDTAAEGTSVDFMSPTGGYPPIQAIYSVGMCNPKGYGTSTVLVINRVSNLSIMAINRGWLLHFMGLDMGNMFFRRSHFFIISKALHKLCLWHHLTLV